MGTHLYLNRYYQQEDENQDNELGMGIHMYFKR